MRANEGSVGGNNAHRSPRFVKLLRSSSMNAVDTLTDDVVAALHNGVAIDVLAHVLFTLNDRAAEKRVLDCDNGILFKPYLVQRLRNVGFEVHVCDVNVLEIVLATMDKSDERAVSLARAMDRYAQRERNRWRNKRNNRPETPPPTPRRVSCVCTTTISLSEFFWNIIDIEAVDFSFTVLSTGTLPPALFKASFCGLRHLVANHCSLQTLTEHISMLSNLETLNVAHNHLVSLPLSLGRLSFLRKIHVSRNKLVVLEKVCLSESLTIIDVSSNRLTTVPVDALAILPLLERLDLSLNRLCEFPRKLGMAPALRWLSLMGNAPPFEINELAVSTLPLGRDLVVVV